MTRSRANVLLLFAGASWGMGFVAQARAMDDIGPFLFIALRFWVASLVVAPFAWRESRRRPASEPSLDRQAMARFALIGVALFLGMTSQQIGLLTTTVTNSGFLTGLYVVITPLLGVLLFRELPHAVVWPAGAIAITGIALLSGGGTGGATSGAGGVAFFAGWTIGDGLTVVSATFWALQVVLIARFVGVSGRPLALSLVQFVVTAALASVVALIAEPIELAAIQRALPSVLYAGVFASGLAFTLQVIGQRWTSAPQAAIFLSSEAPFAALFGYLFLGERIGSSGLIGCGLILLAMLSVELVPMWRRHGHRPLAPEPDG